MAEVWRWASTCEVQKEPSKEAGAVRKKETRSKTRAMRGGDGVGAEGCVLGGEGREEEGRSCGLGPGKAIDSIQKAMDSSGSRGAAECVAGATVASLGRWSPVCVCHVPTGCSQ